MSVHVSSLVWRNGPEAPADRLMMLALADNSDDQGLAWPGVQRLADKCCVTTRSAQRTLRRLESDGWITTHIGGGTRGARDIGIPSRYQMNMSRLQDPDVNVTLESSNPDAHVPNPDVDDTPTLTPTSPEPSLEPSEEPSVVEELDQFDEFWLHYPRKVGKGQARRAWKTAVKKVDQQDIVDAAIDFREWTRRDATDPQFIPHPATWLNGERWADERLPAVEQESNMQAHMRLVNDLVAKNGYSEASDYPEIEGGRP